VFAEKGVHAPHAAEPGSHRDLSEGQFRFQNQTTGKKQSAGLTVSNGRNSVAGGKYPAQMPVAHPQGRGDLSDPPPLSVLQRSRGKADEPFFTFYPFFTFFIEVHALFETYAFVQRHVFLNTYSFLDIYPFINIYTVIDIYAFAGGQVRAAAQTGPKTRVFRRRGRVEETAVFALRPPGWADWAAINFRSGHTEEKPSIEPFVPAFQYFVQIIVIVNMRIAHHRRNIKFSAKNVQSFSDIFVLKAS
jgi:hypothetical protein